MPKHKRIFLLADFKNESTRSIRVQAKMWEKGLIRLGHDVHRFSYRNIMLQESPFPSKRIALTFAKRRTDDIAAEQIKKYKPDIIFILGFKYYDDKTVFKIHQAAPNAMLISREEDPNPEKYPHRMVIAKQTDILISTSAGKFLQTYKNAGVKRCAFIPNVCDPDIQYRYKVANKWHSDIIFTGKPTHTRLGQIGDRYDLIERISKMPQCRVYGAFGVPRVEGLDYFYALSGAKIGLSVNITNDVQLYHSDRLINYLSCGIFTLAKRVPDTELLFEDKKHLRYFDTEEEFFELAEWYLKHDDAREKIAQAGMKHAHNEFNTTKIAGDLLELIENGYCSAKWNYVL